ncbi:MAG: type I methionyl aminopeptidase [Candidatus Paceibacterota bacterium]
MIRLKSKKDIANLREAGKIHDKILDLLGQKCLAGHTTNDINEEAGRLMKDAGVEPAFFGYKPKGAPRPFPAFVCVSVNEEIVHGIPNEKPREFQRGDLVSIDIGLSYQGIITDAAKTFCVGECSKENNELNWATREALWSGIEAVKPGGHIGDIGYAISNFVRKTPFSTVRYLCGHGVGYDVHEDPFVPNVDRKGNGAVLEEGLVIAIEPMLTTGSGDITPSDNGFTYLTKEKTPSAHWEHTVVVTDKGAEVLTEGGS